ncbi:hypothetical protein SBRCBS47491_002169 [Sporothrix bragantina]|uniref:Peptidase S54 rhomboid domain-containing protein n=1 Tax=Sporothrix bragantina TaxID=671064 RepID=A0ABP0B4V8_9PEZI
MSRVVNLPPVRILRPGLWCVAAVGTVYTACGFIDARREVALIEKHRRRREESRSLFPLPTPSHASKIADLPGHTKLMAGLIATNLGVFAMERIMPHSYPLFSHVPAGAAAGGLNTNLTMLTSAFGHVGATHLLLNMYGVVQFLPPVAHSNTFNGDAAHLGAFYLSAGVLSSYAHHLASVWPRKLDRLIPARGASGAVMAIVGVFGMSYPNRQLGIILIPFSLPASDFLALLAAFETYGLFVGFKRLPLAHAAHLAGLAIGSAYVYFDAKRYIWRPVQRWTFRVYYKMYKKWNKIDA